MDRITASASRRIMSDLRANMKSPVAGTSICMPDESDIFTHHVNFQIQNGIYKGIILHCVLHMPHDYPLTGPAMNIAPGLRFGHKFHEHVYEDEHNGNTICNDLLTNFAFFFKNQPPAKASGWTAGCTINEILMQMNIFFEDPDLPKDLIPSASQIDNLRAHVEKYECKTCGHTTAKPYPSIHFDTNIEPAVKQVLSPEAEIAASLEKSRLLLLEKVTCCVSKENIVDNPSVVLGCPLYIHYDKLHRIHAVPIPEFMSYETYAAEIQKHGIDADTDTLSTKTFTSVNGHQYNYWMPLYFFKDHFSRKSQYFYNCFSIIKNGTISGSTMYDYKPSDTIDVLLSLCNKTVVNIFNKEIHESVPIIETYLQFILLLLKFMEMDKGISGRICQKVANFKKGLEFRNKRIVPDLGEFIIMMFLSGTSYESIKPFLLQEFFTRHIYWIKKNGIVRNANDAHSVYLKKVFDQTKVGLQLFVFNLYIANTFINKQMFSIMDARYGFPEELTMDNCIAYIKRIKTELTAMNVFLKIVNFQTEIDTPAKMIDYLKQCEEISITQGYTQADRGGGNNRGGFSNGYSGGGFSNGYSGGGSRGGYSGGSRGGSNRGRR